ncbi:hypothetical protein CDAR_611591 [Caerostris darwini]|uniref:Uncharacterized protein n=1 Tax=Caerostris darwini TaxID=1538125 RepID=A0AAV4U2N5_9ARAC|nr:hypothetical protein CDAR_611591 [Caerostris darwini]
MENIDDTYSPNKDIPVTLEVFDQHLVEEISNNPSILVLKMFSNKSALERKDIGLASITHRGFLIGVNRGQRSLF